MSEPSGTGSGINLFGEGLFSTYINYKHKRFNRAWVSGVPGARKTPSMKSCELKLQWSISKPTKAASMLQISVFIGSNTGDLQVHNLFFASLMLTLSRYRNFKSIIPESIGCFTTHPRYILGKQDRWTVSIKDTGEISVFHNKINWPDAVLLPTGCADASTKLLTAPLVKAVKVETRSSFLFKMSPNLYGEYFWLFPSLSGWKSCKWSFLIPSCSKVIYIFANHSIDHLMWMQSFTYLYCSNNCL